jgi:hypothetical protein
MQRNIQRGSEFNLGLIIILLINKLLDEEIIPEIKGVLPCS